MKISFSTNDSEIVCIQPVDFSSSYTPFKKLLELVVAAELSPARASLESLKQCLKANKTFYILYF